MTKKGRTPPRYTTRWIFGLTYVNDPSYDDDVDVYDGFQSIFLPHFFTMSGVTSLNVLGGNLETLDVGFKNLTTLDMDIFERRDDHYRNVCPTSGPVEEAPALQTLIIRCDCQALESQQDESVPSEEIFLKISFPQLVKHYIVEQSPSPRRVHAGNIGEFDALTEQLTPIAETLEELIISIGPAFDKIFLNYLTPVTTSLTAFSKLRKLLSDWIVLTLATAVPSFAHANISTLLPASPETLRIVHPQANVAVWLNNLFRGPTAVHHANIRKLETVCSRRLNATEVVLRAFQGGALKSLPVEVSLETEIDG
ncbi:hypothetical protein SLS61_003477 [Didymella pomorum]